jgi:putative addiction module killer protein
LPSLDGQITALKALRDLRARAKITQRIDRLELGNPGDVAPVGEGVSEMRIALRGFPTLQESCGMTQ